MFCSFCSHVKLLGRLFPKHNICYPLATKMVSKREEESKSQSLACPYFYDRNVVLAFNRLKALGKLELRKPLLKNDTFTATIPTRATFFRTLECTWKRRWKFLKWLSKSLYRERETSRMWNDLECTENTASHWSSTKIISYDDGSHTTVPSLD